MGYYKMLDQNSIDWLKKNIHDTNGKTTSKVSENKNIPKFVKMYSRSKTGTWYKITKSLQNGTELLVPATQNEIKMWNLK